MSDLENHEHPSSAVALNQNIKKAMQPPRGRNSQPEPMHDSHANALER